MIYHFICYKLWYNVVKIKEGFLCSYVLFQTIKARKTPASVLLLNPIRDENGIPKHRTVVKLGQIDKERIPYLKAAFGNGDPMEILQHELNGS